MMPADISDERRLIFTPHARCEFSASAAEAGFHYLHSDTVSADAYCPPLLILLLISSPTDAMSDFAIRRRRHAILRHAD
jgi:hypothetical protein